MNLWKFSIYFYLSMSYEAFCKKTCHWDFGSGQTQTRLYSLRNKLEAFLETREILLSKQRKTKALINLCRNVVGLRICFSIMQKAGFLIMQII